MLKWFKLVYIFCKMMPTIHHVLGVWTQCQCQLRQILLACVGVNASHEGLYKYQIEAVGSGAILGHCAKKELSKWLKTHQLFLGHGGAEITNVADIPSNFQQPIVACKRVFQGTVVRKIHHGPFGIVWHPSGTMFAYDTCNYTTVCLKKIDGSIVRTIITNDEEPALVWSPEGDILAGIMDAGHVVFWDQHGECIETLAIEGGGTCECGAWSPDGKHFAVGTSRGMVAIWTKDGNLIQSWPTDASFINQIAWNPNGKRFAVAHGAYITLWACNGKHINTFMIRGDVEWVDNLAWSPDGSMLLSAEDTLICTRDCDGNLLQSLDVQYNYICVAWHPQGQIFANSAQNTIQIRKRDGTLLWSSQPQPANVHCILWSPDGSTLISCSGTWSTLWN